MAVLVANPLFTSASAVRGDSSNKPDKPAPADNRRSEKAVSSKTPAAPAKIKARQTDARGQTATLLSDGSLLFVGGQGANGPMAETAIKPASGGEAIAISGSLRYARSWHSATVLPDGTALILGGTGADGQLVKEAEIFDPQSQNFDSITMKLAPRAHHTATLMTDGLVLITGGVSSSGRTVDKAQLWNPRTKDVVTLASRMKTARRNHSARLLSDGRVLLWGGTDSQGRPIDNGEVFDPLNLSFEMVDTQPPVENERLRVEGAVPQDGAVNVAIDSLLAVRFTRPLKVETINTITLTLTNGQGPVDAKVVSAESGMLAFLTPLAPLLPSTPYTLTVAGAADATGALVESATIEFVTSNQGAPKPKIWIPSSENYNGDWSANLPPSPWQELPSYQAEEGVTALSGQVLRVDGWPLAGVVMKIGQQETRTDHTGRFLIRDVEVGRRTLIVDCRPASTRKAQFGLFMIAVDVLKSGKTTALPYTIFSPVLDTKNATKLHSPTKKEVVATSPYLPGLEVHIPRGSVLRDVDGNAIREMTITPVPADRGPFPGPVGVKFPVFFTLQLGGTTLENVDPATTTGMRLVFPNYERVPGGTKIDFWSYDAGGVGWFTYGKGSISADGKQIVPDEGVEIRLFTCASVGSPTEPEGPPCDCSAWDGDPVHLGTGLFVNHQTDLVLPDVIPISLTRIYRQNDPKWRPFGTGTRHPYEMFLVGDQTAYSWADLILPDGGKVRFNRYSSGTGPTGAMMEATSTPTAFYKATLIYYGVSYDGRWDLRMKDGSIYRFSVDGREVAPLSAIIDRNGNQLSVVRYPDPGEGTTGDLQGHRIKRIVSPNGRWVEFTYDASFHITQAKDNTGRVVGYQYDGSGRLWKVTDAMGGVTEYSYDTANRMKTIKDARGIVYLTNDYDVNGRVIKQTQADGGFYQFAYTLDGSGKVTQTVVTDPRGQTRTMTFNASGYSMTDTESCCGGGLSQTVEREAGTNRILAVTDSSGRRTEYGYDSIGNTTSVTRLAGTSEVMTTNLTYEPQFNQLASVTDPLNHTTTFGYDSKGNLISMTDALGHQTTFAYNSAGQMLTTTKALGNTTQFVYEGGDLVKVINPVGQGVTRFVDAAGRVLSVTNALGQSVRYEYDALNRATKMIDPIQGMTQFAYDANSNLLSVTDARGKVTSYVYNNMDQVTTRTDPLTHQETYQYDLNANLTQMTDRKGQVTSYTYDSLDRLSQVTYHDNSTITYTYDSVGRLTQIADSLSGTISYTYDNLNRTLSETTPQGVVSYGYDVASRLTSMTVAGQPAVTYSYDNADRMTAITQSASVVSFTYDDANRRTTKTLPNGAVTEYGYDTASRLTEITYKKGAATLGNLSYEYDAAGRRVKTGGSFARTNLPSAINTATYDDTNRQTGFGSQSLAYDNNGNLTSDGVNTYTWNARDQLLSVSGSGLTASFQYDAFGRRVSKTINSVMMSFVYDGPNIVQEKAGSTVSANMLTGGIDEVFTRSDSSGASSLITDAHGSTVALTNSTGTIQTEYSYEPFGKTSQSGGASNNAAKYTGREDDGTGLYYYRARYYSPVLQRFISEDPIGLEGGINLYAYVDNNPTNFKDSFGLDKTKGMSDPSMGTYQDQWYGHDDKDFRDWFHRCLKRPGDPDATKEQIEEAYEEWLNRGSPNGDNCWGAQQPVFNPERSAKRDWQGGRRKGKHKFQVNPWPLTQPTATELALREASHRYMEQACTDVLYWSIVLGSAFLGRPSAAPRPAPVPIPALAH